MNTCSVKNIWLILNLCFLANYTLAILRIFVAFPVPCLPAFFNSICLFFAYALTLQALIASFSIQNISKLTKKLINHPNSFCLIVFLFLLPNVLLIPFYLLSLYHVASAVVARKNEFSGFFFYEFCVFIDKNLTAVGRTALLLEVMCIPVALVLLIIRRISLISFAVYCFMVRHQYQTNETMKSVCMELFVSFNDLLMRMPDGFKTKYTKIVEYFNGFVKKEASSLKALETKKKQ